MRSEIAKPPATMPICWIIGCEDLAGFRPVGDETNRPAWPVPMGPKFLLERKQLASASTSKASALNAFRLLRRQLR